MMIEKINTNVKIRHEVKNISAGIDNLVSGRLLILRLAENKEGKGE
ncbi:MAG: hypothetical protein RRY79_00185 [Clostridia bacterium]